MQLVLIDQKENAFLSQKLATIVTHLKVNTHLATDSSLATHMSESAVIDFLKLYEFKSLIPSNHREIQKTLEIRTSEIIKNKEAFDNMIKSLFDSEDKKIYLSTQNNGFVNISSSQSAYSLNLYSLDVSDELLKFLQNSQITVIGYDLKEDIKNILRIKKSLQ